MARSSGRELTVESDGNEEDHKLAPNGNAERHANEDAVEQDANLEEHALKNVLLQLLVLGQEVRGREHFGVLDAVRAGAGALGFQPSSATPVGVARGELPLGRNLVVLLPHLDGAAISRRAGLRAVERAAEPITGPRGAGRGAAGEVARGAEDHLDDDDEEDADERDGAGHGLVVLGPEGAEAGVVEALKGRGEEVHEGGGDEDAGAEVADGEEDGIRDAQARDALGDQGEEAREGRDEHDDDEGADVQGHVVVLGSDAVALAFVAAVEARGGGRGRGRASGDGDGGVGGAVGQAEGGHDGGRRQDGDDPPGPAPDLGVSESAKQVLETFLERNRLQAKGRA